ncbi:MAG TPA: CocE/NonD family hydrolase [Bryobacteraceae bacterium]|nr:CocE/NonD family hydrolase [Bryobacteraceae bacterium]
MTSTAWRLSACCALAVWPAAAQVTFPAPRPPSNDIRIENHVPVRMRDGVVLYADVYRPVKQGRYPVLVSRTPYSTERFPDAYAAAVFFARRGYVFVFQDVRGRHESDGKWDPFRNEQEDGYDTVEWAAAQPWSNGKVGMEGASYLGFVQWQAAVKAPPHLVAIFPNLASTSIYHDTITFNGGFRLSLAFGWGPVRQESRIMQNPGVHTMGDGIEELSFDKILWHLPLNDMQRLAGRNAQFYRDWLAHPDYDDYWKPLSVEDRFESIAIPVHTFGGWYDILAQGTLHGFEGMSHKGKTTLAREQSKMVIGPWGHGATRKYGDIDFGEQAMVDAHALELHWYDYWLKGIDNGVPQDPPVRLFVMGRNQWRAEKEFPLSRAEYRKLYLHSGGNANSERGDGQLSWNEPAAGAHPDHYRYDPDLPVPSVGGSNCCGTPTPAGPVDQRVVERRHDVLVYTSDYLAEELEVTGPLKLVLYASSDAPDTDFIAKLVDVYPDGRAINLAEGIVRARYRESLSRPRPLEPGKVYAFEIDMLATSNVFLKGHRIRVDVTSSHFPQFDRNPNTGEPFGASARVRVAAQTVEHSRVYPSHILLPVIPVTRP